MWSSTRTELLPNASLPVSPEGSQNVTKQIDKSKMLNLNDIIDQLAVEHQLMYEVALSKWHPDEALKFK